MINTDTKKGEILALSSTFTIDPILPGINYWAKEFGFQLDIQIAPYNQVFQELLNTDSILVRNKKGLNVIFIKIDDWIRNLNDNKIFNSKIKQTLEKIVNDFLKAINVYNSRNPCTTLLFMCPQNPKETVNKNRTCLNRKLKQKITKIIDTLESVEIVDLEKYDKIYQVDNIYDPLKDEIGHIPYQKSYYYYLATLIIRRYFALRNKPYKVIALDCDNTLWQGVCGEVGPYNVKVEGMYHDLQAFMVKQSQAGMLLCLCSKNVEEDVHNVFAKQDSMPLKKDLIVDSRINWQPKSENIRSLAKSLNLGLDSFIFIDDNPVECAEVKARCPEVFVIPWDPDTINDVHRFFNHLWIFDHHSTTGEDSRRTQMYKANIKRDNFRESCDDFDKFLESLNLKIYIKKAANTVLKRVVQLINRTNQFNFTTIRRTMNELKKLLDDSNVDCYTVEVEDRFGSYGIVGVMIVESKDTVLRLDTFLLSCRVLGKNVERKMMVFLCELAKKQKKDRIIIDFIETAKNIPAKLFITGIGEKYQTNVNDYIQFNIAVSYLNKVI